MKWLNSGEISHKMIKHRVQIDSGVDNLVHHSGICQKITREWGESIFDWQGDRQNEEAQKENADLHFMGFMTSKCKLTSVISISD